MGPHGAMLGRLGGCAQALAQSGNRLRGYGNTICRLKNLSGPGRPWLARARSTDAATRLTTGQAALLDEQQKERLELYLDTLFDWNERMNLIGTGIRNEGTRSGVSGRLCCRR